MECHGRIGVAKEVGLVEQRQRPPPPDGPGPFLWNEEAQEWRRMSTDGTYTPRVAMCVCRHEVGDHERLTQTGRRPCRLCPCNDFHPLRVPTP